MSFIIYHVVLVRSVMLIEKHVLRDVLGDGGWECKVCVRFKYLRTPPATAKEANIVFNYKPGKVCVYYVHPKCTFWGSIVCSVC